MKRIQLFQKEQTLRLERGSLAGLHQTKEPSNSEQRQNREYD
jgi:hypothetical protein